MPAPPAGVLPQALLAAWQGQRRWLLLDTHFGSGHRFLALWHAWQRDPARPKQLHVVALLPEVTPLKTLRAQADANAEYQPLIDALAHHWWGLLPGFHRLLLDHGRVTLTLCIGPTLQMLREQKFLADAIYFDTPLPSTPPEDAQAAVAPWDDWQLKALIRCCRRGTLLTLTEPEPDGRARLQRLGFELPPPLHATPHSAPGWQPALITARYHPTWEIRLSRHARPQPDLASASGHCVVVGAGLAGASVAAALARRGWQVTVLDTAPEPAAGASGLPVGLASPHTSADDSPRSRLSRCGLTLTLQTCQQHLVAGQDWQPSGVLELPGHGQPPRLPRHWPAEGQDWSHACSPAQATEAQAGWASGLNTETTALWHRRGAWIKPARLVHAWLATPGVRFQGRAQVAALHRDAERWLLLDEHHAAIARADHVVLANALGSVPLLQQLLSEGLIAGPTQSGRAQGLQGTRGQVTWATQQASNVNRLPPFPVNGLGSFIPHVPLNATPDACLADPAQHLAWYAGATFEPLETAPSTPAEDHASNLARLAHLLPAVAADVAAHVAPQGQSGTLQAWRQTRCNSTDRLPVVGPLNAGPTPSLWISTAMGSRGLSLAALCAELLAARMHGEPLPVEASLARHLWSLREK